MKKYLLICVAALIGLSSCSQEDLTNLSETIYVRSEGADMPAYIHGNGASKVFILVVHGGPGGNGLEYRAGTYAEELEARYAMVYWDQRGQGMSQGHYSPDEVTTEQMADDLYLLALAIKAKYGQDNAVFVMGHSWGGMLGSAMMVKDDYQNVVNGWIESNGAHDIPRLNRMAIPMFIEIGNQQITAGNSVAEWQDIVDWAQTIDTNNISLAQGGEINSNGFKAEELLTNDGLIQPGEEAFRLSGGINPTNGLISNITGNNTSDLLENEVENLSLTDQLSKINRPCLFLYSKYDFVVPPQLGLDAFAAVNTTDKKFVLFEESGHSPMDNEPAKFVAEVVEFVEQYK